MEEKQQKRVRIEWLDVLKALGMFIVLCGHVSRDKTPDTLRFYLYSFHMPLFFILSGMGSYFQLSRKEISVGKFLKGKVQTLLWPYFAINVLLIPLWCLNHKILTQSKETIKELVLAIFYSNQKWNSLPTSTTWFLTTLFLSLVLFFLILKLCRKKERWIFLVGCGVGLLGFVMSKTELNNIVFPWHANTALMGCFLLMVGYVFMAHNAQIERFVFANRIRPLVILPLCVLLGYVCAYHNVKISMAVNSYGALHLFLGAVFAFSFACYILSHMIPPLPVIQLIGRNTIVYLALHEQIYKLYRHTLPILNTLIEEYPYVAASMTFVALIPVAWFMERYCSVIITGKRRNPAAR